MASLRPIALIITLAVLLVSACAQAEHPVSWDSSLGLNSQADIQEALSAPWEDAAPFNSTVSETERMVRNCLEYRQAIDQGYEPLNNLVAAYVIDKAAYCNVLFKLSAAQPSEQTYIADFSLDQETIGTLPPQVGFIISEERTSLASRAYAAGQGLGDFEAYSVIESSREHAQIAGDDWVMKLDVVAHGDFNADGIEDLLMKVNYRATEGSYRDSRVFVLTRTEKSGRIQLVELDDPQLRDSQ